MNFKYVVFVVVMLANCGLLGYGIYTDDKVYCLVAVLDMVGVTLSSLYRVEDFQ